MSTFKWNDEVTAQLLNLVGTASPVTGEAVEAAAQELGTTSRSVAAKLRKLGHNVASMAKVREPKFSPGDTEALKVFVSENEGKYTYTEIAANFLEGKYEPKVIQGKILSLDLTASVKKTEKVTEPRTYTPEQESIFLSMANAGACVEDMAKALGKSIPAIRGKALSYLRTGELKALPKQAVKVDNVDPVEEILAKLPTMKIAEIAETLGKTDRGVKTMLTRRGLTCVDYDGAAKKAKKAEAVA
jgi:hypothetical protein